MSKKLIIIIVSTILTLLFLSLLGYYFIISNNDGTNNNTVVSGFKNFFPFGGSENTPSQEVGNNQDNQDQNDTSEKPVEFTKKLRKISSEPVSGGGTLDSKAGTIVRYIEKATGHIYEVDLFSPKVARISNTTIPLSYDAIWGNKNESFIARYLKVDNNTVDTFSLTVKNNSTSTENTITGTAFPDKIFDVSILGSSVFYLQNTLGGSVGVISTFDGSKKKEIWNSPIREITSQYVNEKTVTLNTKPLEGVNGFLYSVNTATGAIKKLLSGFGLTSLVNSDISKILYITQGSEIKALVFDSKTNTSTEIFPVTFPEKCVWSVKDKNIIYCAVPKGYLTAKSLSLWYKGQLSTSDDIWRFDVKDNTTVIIGDINKESGEEIDVIKPILSESEQYLVFVNKKDNSLWSLDILK